MNDLLIDLDPFWELLGWIFALKADAFRLAVLFMSYPTFAVIIVLLAGLSQAIAGSIILFLNQVKPLRFVLSLFINVLIFTVGYSFQVLSTYLITLITWSVHVSFSTLATIIGLSYAPYIFSFFGALPYLGLPILSLLSIWHLLALVVGFASVTKVGIAGAFGYVVLGWIVLQILQQTVGQPIANLGQWLANKTAGVDLVVTQQELSELLSNRINTWQEELSERIAEIQLTNPFKSLPSPLSSQERLSDLLHPTQPESSRTLATFVGLVGMTLLTLLVVIMLGPVRRWLFGWHDSLPTVLQFSFDLVWIGLIAIVVAGLLAPLETLGWWAGWYNDDVDTTLNAGTLAKPVKNPQTITRYVVYLDGIGKSNFEYLPDIEEFLDTLTPTLPEGVALIRGIMTYSVLNNPLDEDRPLAFLWQLADKSRFANPASLLGLLVNIRNIFVVGVSADQRYGPIYNQGIAQIIFNGLVNNGYPVGSGIPITLIGYSGGGQMAAACATFLKSALSTPIDVISLGGVISGNCKLLKLDHLYHLRGDKDVVERIGPVMFPGRWQLFPLSYWNRAKRYGKISLISLGPVGHQVPGGILDPNVILSDGRSALKQTIDYINSILRGNLLSTEVVTSIQPSNYGLYQQFLSNNDFPLTQSLSPDLYHPISQWIGRLILPQPEERQAVQGAFLEIYHADKQYQDLVGKTVKLRFNNDAATQKRVRAVKRDVYFSAQASYTSKYGGLIHPVRLNHWLQVNPLESLAGSHPKDDIIVMLDEMVEVQDEILYIRNQPIQITGRYYALVKFIQPVQGTDQFSVVHFNRVSGEFDGVEEIVQMPQVIADKNGCFPSSVRDIEQSYPNEAGWYIYGAQNEKRMFVVQSLAPRALFQLQPERVILGKDAAYHYIRKEAWAHIVEQKGKISSVLLLNDTVDPSLPPLDPPSVPPLKGGKLESEWQEGDRALVLHVYGGIGGKNAEPAAATPLFFGHFAYGMAQVIREPLSDELRFDIRYYQVYTHNTDGIVAGILHWSRYLGDRQFGWVGVRPVADILIKLDAFTQYYDFYGFKVSPLDLMIDQLQVMTSRYRIGDGTGGTYVGPANNCSQDSNQAFLASLRQMERMIQANQDMLQQWEKDYPLQVQRFQQLLQLKKKLQLELQPLGGTRLDWENNEYNLGSTLEDKPLQNLIAGLGSWRSLLPRLASDTVVKIFIDQGASVWVLRTNQIGGYDPTIEPIAPITL